MPPFGSDTTGHQRKQAKTLALRPSLSVGGSPSQGHAHPETVETRMHANAMQRPRNFFQESNKFAGRGGGIAYPNCRAVNVAPSLGCSNGSRTASRSINHGQQMDRHPDRQTETSGVDASAVPASVHVHPFSSTGPWKISCRKRVRGDGAPVVLLVVVVVLAVLLTLTDIRVSIAPHLSIISFH